MGHSMLNQHKTIVTVTDLDEIYGPELTEAAQKLLLYIALWEECCYLNYNMHFL